MTGILFLTSLILFNTPSSQQAQCDCCEAQLTIEYPGLFSGQATALKQNGRTVGAGVFFLDLEEVVAADDEARAHANGAKAFNIASIPFFLLSAGLVASSTLGYLNIVRYGAEDQVVVSTAMLIGSFFSLTAASTLLSLANREFVSSVSSYNKKFCSCPPR